MKTLAPFSITQTTAGSGGFQLSGSITEKGVVWGTSHNPTWSLGLTQGQKGIVTSSTSNYVIWITGLVPNTKYYVRAYSITSNTASYSPEFSFVTKAVMDGEEAPECTTKDITLNPGQVYNLPPNAEVVSLVATEEQALLLKSECSTFSSIINELIGDAESE